VNTNYREGNSDVNLNTNDGELQKKVKKSEEKFAFWGPSEF